MQWFRMYAEVRRDPKIQTLSGNLVKAWLNFMCFAADNHGYLPAAKVMAWELRSTEKRIDLDIVALLAAELIEDRPEGFYMHNWNVRQFQSDSSTKRVREHRQKRNGTLPEQSGNVSCNGAVTHPEQITETDTETEGGISDFDLALDRVSAEMHGRHPPHRRCSAAMVKTKLRAITKKIPTSQRISKIEWISANHAAWCLYWEEDNGKYAKSLENWLAPSMGRFNEEPPAIIPSGKTVEQPRRLMF